MDGRSNVSPVPLPVHRNAGGIQVEYLDGRRVTYGAPREETDGPVEATVTFEVHVLVVDPEREEGIMVYLNDYDTDDEILETTGVGRVLLAPEAREVIYPGVAVRRVGDRVRVTTEEPLEAAAVYVFVENELGERAYHLAASDDHCR